MPTFAGLGIPFPLFEADTERAVEYVGIHRCSLCGAGQVHCFKLGIGADVIVTCPSCGNETPLDADDKKGANCQSCSKPIPFPKVGGSGQLVACYQCLRSGKAALTKDTVLGMVRWEDAQRGSTHGRPGLDTTDFETIPKEDDWVAARVPEEHLMELVRTPTYSTIQGDQWQFCCRRPMTFIGEWDRDDFDRNAPDGNGKAFFQEIVQDVVDGLWEDELHDETGIYVFRCKQCGRLTAHWDIA